MVKGLSKKEISKLRVLIWDDYNDDWIKHTKGGRADKKIYAKLKKAYNKRKKEGR